MRSNLLLAVLSCFLFFGCGNNEDFECSENKYTLQGLVHEEIVYYAGTNTGLVEIEPAGSLLEIESSLDQIFLEDFQLFNFTALQALEFLPGNQLKLTLATLPISLNGTTTESIISYELDENGVISSSGFESLTNAIQGNLDEAIQVDANCSQVSTGLQMVRFIKPGTVIGDIEGTELRERKLSRTISELAEIARVNLDLEEGDSIAFAFSRLIYN